jgi:multicomponent Na+:H+ antiporter subunit G
VSFDNVLDVVSGVCLAGGALFAMVGGLGIVRFPDFYSRMHGGSITDTMGAGLILGGLMLQSEHWLVTVKLLTILFFLLITSPTSAHALSQSARAHGVEPLLHGQKREEDSPSKP